MIRQPGVILALLLVGACGAGRGDASAQESTLAGASGAAPPVSIDLPAEPPCAAGDIATTPRRSDGGHYRAGAPEKLSLREPGVDGTPLVITGYVLFPDCRPVAGAVLDVWQADARGRYDDEGWRLRGIVRSDEAGRYVIETIVPGAADGAAPTVRLKTSEEVGGRILTTQLFFPDEPANATDRSYRPELVADVSDGPDGVHARFDVVIEVG